MMEDLQSLVADVRAGKGTVGAMLTDSAMAGNLEGALERINTVEVHLDTICGQLSRFVLLVHNDVKRGKGVANALLEDSATAARLNSSLEHIEQGTKAFNENMEALQHSFLFRGYFRKVEKAKQKERESPPKTN